MTIRAWCMGSCPNTCVTKERPKRSTNNKYCNGKKKHPKDIDLFRDTPLRYLGYANEVGEAFRGTVRKEFVTASYLLASAYVLADVGAKSSDTWRANCKETSCTRAKETLKTGFEVLLWQSLASIIIPGIVINRICALTRYLACRTPACKHTNTITTAVGLLSIPIIIGPIDRLVDAFMYNIVKPILHGD